MTRLLRVAASILTILVGTPAIAGDRLVVVGGALAEIVAALGRGDRIVGVDSTAVHPPSVAALPKVGYLRQLSAEGVLSLRPDRVVLSPEAGPPAAVRQLRAARIPILSVTEGYSPAALARRIDEIATAIEAVDDGRRLADLTVTRFDRLARELGARRGDPRVLFVLAGQGGALQASGSGTAADAMIALAGGRNPIRAYEGYRALTIEAAIAAAPDVVLLASHGVDAAGGIEKVAAMPALAMTPAGRAGRMLVMDSAFLLGFGPRAPQAAATLARALHPDLPITVDQ